MFGFPFEAMTNATRRQNAIDRIFDFFGLAAIGPDNADFNNNGTVDAADYVIWRKYNGTSVPPGTLGDADHNGQVNSLDYNIFQAQFGTSPGAGGAAATSVATESAGESPAGAAASPAATSVIESSADSEPFSSQDVLFSTILIELRGNRPPQRPLVELRTDAAALAIDSDRVALLTSLTERKAARNAAVVNAAPPDDRQRDTDDVNRAEGKLRDKLLPEGVLHGLE
jgi:hypothetical protein